MRRSPRACLALASSLLAVLAGAIPAPAIEQKLVASDAAEKDYLGWDVDVDGDTAVVGAVQDDDRSPGVVYVFQRSGDSWAQTARLQASDSQVGDRFGQSVAIDGDTIVVGAPVHIIGSTNAAGAVYTFARTGAPDRKETAKLTVAVPANRGLGGQVAIDGETIAAGATGDTTASMLSHGAVYTFERTGGDRNEKARLLASDRGQGDQLGYSVAVDGDTIVAGASYKQSTAQGSDFLRGAAYTFEAGTTGTGDETARLVPFDQAGLDRIGSSVAIEGDTIVVGAFRDSFPNRNYVGSAYTFARTGDSPRGQTGKLVASDGLTEDGFGYSVAIDGPTIAVGSYLDDNGSGVENRDWGSVYTFASSSPDAERSELAKLRPADTAHDDYVGTSVAMDGDVIITGATGDDTGAGYDQGSATVFFSPATEAACSDGGDNDGDGKVDFPADPGCSSPDDTSEADAAATPTATPTPTPTATPPSGGGPGGSGPVTGGDGSEKPRIVRPRTTFPVDVTQGGRFRLKAKVICAEGPYHCNGKTFVVYELERVQTARAAAARSVRLGSSAFKVAAGGTVAVPGKLTKKGRKLLAKRRRLKVKVKIVVTTPGAPAARSTVKATLRAPKRR